MDKRENRGFKEYRDFYKSLGILLYYVNMEKEKFLNKRLGAFIVPTGIGASIGGYAGDASVWARRFAKECNLIVNPNVVNAGGFSGITESMFYVEGFSINEFFKGKIGLLPSNENKVGVVFDKSISEDVLNIHINTMNAVKTVYGTNILGYEITEEDVGVEFFIDKSNISTGSVKNIQTLLDASKKMLKRGANAIALVCKFEEEDDDEDYSNGAGVDPVGGVEAILSHYISKELKVPVAHSPAFEDYSIYPKIVNPKASSEYITPTFLPCILLGLSQAPLITTNNDKNITIKDLDFLVMPYNALGSTPVFEAIKRGIEVFAIKENSTLIDVTAQNLKIENNVTVLNTYQECLNIIKTL